MRNATEKNVSIKFAANDILSFGDTVCCHEVEGFGYCLSLICSDAIELKAMLIRKIAEAHGLKIAREGDFCWDNGECDWEVMLLITPSQLEELQDGSNTLHVNLLAE